MSYSSKSRRDRRSRRHREPILFSTGDKVSLALLGLLAFLSMAIGAWLGYALQGLDINYSPGHRMVTTADQHNCGSETFSRPSVGRIRLLAKSGVEQGGMGTGISPVGRENRVIFRRKIMRDTPCAARGAEPLASCSWRWGVAGRVDLPAEVGGVEPKDRR